MCISRQIRNNFFFNNCTCRIMLVESVQKKVLIIRKGLYFDLYIYIHKIKYMI